MGAYLIGAKGSSIEAMYRAMEAFLQRKVKREDHRFAPSAAEFAEQCRDQQSIINYENRPKIATSAEKRPAAPPVSADKIKLLRDFTKGSKTAESKLRRMGYLK